MSTQLAEARSEAAQDAEIAALKRRLEASEGQQVG
jgi:hypothetical protein